MARELFVAAFSLCPLASVLWCLTKLLTHEKKISRDLFVYIYIPGHFLFLAK